MLDGKGSSLGSAGGFTYIISKFKASLNKATEIENRSVVARGSVAGGVESC